MSLLLPDYPSLELVAFQDQWLEYTRTAKRDVDTPKQLIDWWQAHPPSAFRERIIFLIQSPVSSASVERFFSMCGQVDADQWALSQNSRRLQFMLQYNGDLEGRL